MLSPSRTSTARTVRAVRTLVVAGGLLACLTVAASTPAFERPRSGWYLTGSAAKAVSPGGAGVKPAKDYTITHEMRGLPAAKTKRGVIDADVDKRFTWHVHRDIPCAALKTALRVGFSRNAYATAAKITPFVDVCAGPTLKARSTVVISYAAATKTTTVWMQGLGTATLGGVDFMKAVWSVWLGNVDQAQLGEALVARL